MEKSLFIGVDFSKKSFDVSVLHQDNLLHVDYCQFENSKEGCIAMHKWLRGLTTEPSSQWLFCGEHTGLYSVCLSEFLVKKELFIWLENSLQIKQSSGIRREKNDKSDSRDIALYAYRFQDKAKRYHLQGKSLQALELLLSFRERLLANKHSLLVSAKEIRSVMNRNVTDRYIYEQSQKDIGGVSN